MSVLFLSCLLGEAGRKECRKIKQFSLLFYSTLSFPPSSLHRLSREDLMQLVSEELLQRRVFGVARGAGGGGSTCSRKSPL